MRPSQSIPQAPRNSPDAPAEQLSMRNLNTRRKDKQTSSSRGCRGPCSENEHTRAGAKETPSEQHKERHAETTNPFRLDLFTVFGLTTAQSAISLSSSGHTLNTEFSLGLGFPPWPCVRPASSVPIFPEEPTSRWLAHLRHSMPYITSHLGNCTAPAPSKARAVCVARLKLLGNTSNTVQSAGPRLWPTRQEQRPAHGDNGPSCPLARAKALQSA